MSKEIKPSLSDGIPAPTKIVRKHKPVDIGSLVLEDTGPPQKARTTRKTSALVAFVKTMKIGQSFLISKDNAAAAQRAICLAFGKGSAAVRVIDLEYSRVYRIK